MMNATKIKTLIRVGIGGSLSFWFRRERMSHGLIA